MKRKTILTASLILISMMGLLTGCTSEASLISNAQEKEDGSGTGNSVSDLPSNYYFPVGTYDSADTAILEAIDTEAGTVTLYNTYAAKTYTLKYDGTTYVSDKYGTTMSIEQLTEGQIVNVNFLKSSKQLVDIQVSPDAWTYENVSKYDLGGINSTASIGDRTYALTDGVQVFSNGEPADLMDIVSGDVLTVSGIGADIYSIKVDNGHGYVRLDNDEALIGGWIEIGNKVITRVTEDMLLAVPEGQYAVKMYNDYSSITQQVNVERNEEVILDCSEITAPEDVFGKILFNITPDTAVLYLDGVEQDTTGVVQTTFGRHQIEVSADGYDTLCKYINVGSDVAEITINLDESTEISAVSDNSSYSSTSSSDASTVSANSASSNSSTTSTTSGNTTTSTVSGNSTSSTTTTSTSSTSNKVYVSYPEGAEVYVDGVYVGLTPMSFKKVAGSHTVILKKTGYVTKSYTIYLYNDGDDISISFSDLEAE